MYNGFHDVLYYFNTTNDFASSRNTLNLYEHNVRPHFLFGSRDDAGFSSLLKTRESNKSSSGKTKDITFYDVDLEILEKYGKFVGMII